MPGYRGLVPRYTHLKYRADDRHGVLFEREVTGFHAWLNANARAFESSFHQGSKPAGNTWHAPAALGLSERL